MTQELLPCECGGEARLGADAEHNADPFGQWYAGCLKCHRQTIAPRGLTDDNKGIAIEMWNRRRTPDAASEKVRREVAGRVNDAKRELMAFRNELGEEQPPDDRAIDWLADIIDSLVESSAKLLEGLDAET